MKKILNFVAAALLGGCLATGDQASTEQVGEARQGVISNDVSMTCSLTGTITTIASSEMPRDWYFPATIKTPIILDWVAAETSSTPDANCQPAAGGTFSSMDGVGTFHPVMTSTGKISGYWWQATHDLAGLENHWHNYVTCDGLTVPVGCPDARKVSYTLSVGGACLAAGGTCTDTETVSLPAIQDADVVELNCTVECESSLGECVSQCHATCNGGEADCNCCECQCKEYLHTTNPACQAPQPSCYDSCL